METVTPPCQPWICPYPKAQDTPRGTRWVCPGCGTRYRMTGRKRAWPWRRMFAPHGHWVLAHPWTDAAAAMWADLRGQRRVDQMPSFDQYAGERRTYVRARAAEPQPEPPAAPPPLTPAAAQARLDEGEQRLAALPPTTQQLLRHELAKWRKVVATIDVEHPGKTSVGSWFDEGVERLVAEIAVIADALERKS